MHKVQAKKVQINMYHTCDEATREGTNMYHTCDQAKREGTNMRTASVFKISSHAEN